MPIDWNALPGLPTRVAAGPVPDHFGDLQGELAAVSTESKAAFALTDYAWIRCSGPDARSFLHNQLTSDVNHLAPGRWQHSAWCTAKGRMLANFVLVHSDTPDTFLIAMPAELLPAILKRMRMFILRTKVVLDDLSGSYATLGVLGSGLDRALADLGVKVSPAADETVAFGDGWILRLSTGSALLVAMTEQLPTLNTLPQRARPVGLLAWKLAEVRNGVAVIRAPTQEEFVPQMVNFDKLGGVSFHKGCYPGQEVIARTQYLGKVKRHLYRVRSSEEIQPGQSLYPSGPGVDPGTACGTIANAAPSPDGGWVALAVVLESSSDARIHAGSPEGPTLSNIDLVAA
jgi:tRNA-modifying protein YgfZ